MSTNIVELVFFCVITGKDCGCSFFEMISIVQFLARIYMICIYVYIFVYYESPSAKFLVFLKVLSAI